MHKAAALCLSTALGLAALASTPAHACVRRGAVPIRVRANPIARWFANGTCATQTTPIFDIHFTVPAAGGVSSVTSLLGAPQACGASPCNMVTINYPAALNGRNDTVTFVLPVGVTPQPGTGYCTDMAHNKIAGSDFTTTFTGAPAANNVQLLLDGFVTHAATPGQTCACGMNMSKLTAVAGSSAPYILDDTTGGTIDGFVFGASSTAATSISNDSSTFGGGAFDGFTAPIGMNIPADADATLEFDVALQPGFTMDDLLQEVEGTMDAIGTGLATDSAGDVDPANFDFVQPVTSPIVPALGGPVGAFGLAALIAVGGTILLRPRRRQDAFV